MPKGLPGKGRLFLFWYTAKFPGNLPLTLSCLTIILHSRLQCMEATEGNEKKELLIKSELSIWLDVYDDVFSDFDSRPLSERALSDDFLNEVRKMVREKPTGNVELKLLIPAALRDTKTEGIITRNLHAHFRHSAQLVRSDIRSTIGQGIILSTVGFALMIGTAYLAGIKVKEFYLNSIQIIMEPAGWFMVWAGLDNIFNDARKKRPNLDFNTKMAHAEITFLSF